MRAFALPRRAERRAHSRGNAARSPRPGHPLRALFRACNGAYRAERMRAVAPGNAAAPAAALAARLPAGDLARRRRIRVARGRLRRHAAARGALATPRFLDDHEFATLEALCDRILPPDHDPGAKQLGAARYVERLLTAFDSGETPFLYTGGPFSGRNPYPGPGDRNRRATCSRRTPSRRRSRRAACRSCTGAPRSSAAKRRVCPRTSKQQWGGTLVGLRDVYRDGLAIVDEVAQAHGGAAFAELDVASQDEVLALLDADGVFPADPVRGYELPRRRDPPHARRLLLGTRVRRQRRRRRLAHARHRGRLAAARLLDLPRAERRSRRAPRPSALDAESRRDRRRTDRSRRARSRPTAMPCSRPSPTTPRCSSSSCPAPADSATMARSREQLFDVARQPRPHAFRLLRDRQRRGRRHRGPRAQRPPARTSWCSKPATTRSPVSTSPVAIPPPLHSNDELKYGVRGYLETPGLLVPRTFRTDARQAARHPAATSTRCPQALGGAFQHADMKTPRFNVVDFELRSHVESLIGSTPGLARPRLRQRRRQRQLRRLALLLRGPRALLRRGGDPLRRRGNGRQPVRVVAQRALPDAARQSDVPLAAARRGRAQHALRRRLPAPAHLSRRDQLASLRRPPRLQRLRSLLRLRLPEPREGLARRDGTAPRAAHEPLPGPLQRARPLDRQRRRPRRRRPLPRRRRHPPHRASPTPTCSPRARSNPRASACSRTSRTAPRSATPATRSVAT